MPVVTFPRKGLCSLIGEDIPLATLAERMPMIGGDLDKVENDAITIEWFPDRPDLLTEEGTARAVAAFMGQRPGMPRYEVAPAKTRLEVDASVQAIRPYAALCYVRGVAFDDALVKATMDAQEKLTLAPGRKRRKIAIGVHDATGVEGPFRYTAVARDALTFVPLQMEAPMTPADILGKHPKGQEYGHLVPDDVPVFLDGAGEVISMPPVINAAKTAVTTATTDLLIDVTGTDAASVRRTIALLATGFADRGGRIEAIEVHDASGTWTCPDLRPSERVVQTEAVHRWLGKPLDGDEIAQSLRRMGMDAEGFDTQVLVQVPAWRFDILHDMDLIEDVAIGHGYENFEGTLPRQVTFAAGLPIHGVEGKARAALLGLGFSEARTLTLSNDADQWGHWGADSEPAVRVHNPVVEDQVLLRTRVVPSLLRVLGANRHRPLPQRLFETGYTVHQQGDDWRNRMHLAAVECGAKVGFSDAKGLVESVVRDLGIEATLRATDIPGFIAGRSGQVVYDGAVVGVFGELHPDVLVAFGLGAASVALELDLEAL